MKCTIRHHPTCNENNIMVDDMQEDNVLLCFVISNIFCSTYGICIFVFAKLGTNFTSQLSFSIHFFKWLFPVFAVDNVFSQISDLLSIFFLSDFENQFRFKEISRYFIFTFFPQLEQKRENVIQPFKIVETRRRISDSF